MDSCRTEQLQGVSHLELARAAVLAPSPDNNQPWRLLSIGDRLEIYLDPERGLPSDVNSMYDLMGIGAVIENAVIAARQLGFLTEVDYARNRRDLSATAAPRPAATLRFRAGGDPDPLHGQLASRSTNRRLYSTQPVEKAALERIAAQTREFPEVQFDWVTDRRRIRAFARLIAASDRFRFEYEPFHKEIFRQLRFTAQQAEATRDGLDVRTLELPPGAAVIIRSLRLWPRMKLVNRSGLGRLLTLPSWVSVRKSGALGVLSLPEASVEGFLRGGRAFQRIWLAAQAECLALQPLGSLAIFIGQMEQLAGRNLHAAHRRLSGRLGRWCRQLVPATEGRTLLMVFRVGHGRPPQVRSLRRPAEDVLERLGTGESWSKRVGAKGTSASSTGNRPRPQQTARDALAWTYEEAFSRNLGLISPAEQQRLRSSRVAIAGMGGVGGIHLVTLARLGIGKFTIADGDRFEVANFNRQYGATTRALGRPKATVMAEEAKSINPEVDLRVFSESITAATVDRFLADVDLLVDAIDFFAFDARRMLYAAARERGMWVVTAGPIGFSTAWLLFDPHGMTFERYFDLRQGMAPVDQFTAFFMGLTPRGTHFPYFDLSYVDRRTARGPSVALACQLSSGVVGVEVAKILLDRKPLQPAPYYAQFDAYRWLLRRGRLRWGNRGPLQRLKRALLRRRMLSLGYGQ